MAPLMLLFFPRPSDISCSQSPPPVLSVLHSPSFSFSFCLCFSAKLLLTSYLCPCAFCPLPGLRSLPSPKPPNPTSTLRIPSYRGPYCPASSVSFLVPIPISAPLPTPAVFFPGPTALCFSTCRSTSIAMATRRWRAPSRDAYSGTEAKTCKMCPSLYSTSP